MKKTFFYHLLLMLIITSTSCSAQTDNHVDEVKQSLNKIEINTAPPIYKIYPTKNMWNFLKLDTRNGIITIVQFSVEDNKRFEYTLSNTPLCDGTTPGRFILCPTENMYNFILLDQVSGQTYQVQWSFEENKRFVIPIY